jgi:hypothetical protein
MDITYCSKLAIIIFKLQNLNFNRNQEDEFFPVIAELVARSRAYWVLRRNAADMQALRENETHP